MKKTTMTILLLLCLQACNTCEQYSLYRTEYKPDLAVKDRKKDKLYSGFYEYTLIKQSPKPKVKMYPWSVHHKADIDNTLPILTKNNEHLKLVIETWENCSCKQPEFNPCDYSSHDDDLSYLGRDCVSYILKNGK